MRLWLSLTCDRACPLTANGVLLEHVDTACADICLRCIKRCVCADTFADYDLNSEMIYWDVRFTCWPCHKFKIFKPSCVWCAILNYRVVIPLCTYTKHSTYNFRSYILLHRVCWSWNLFDFVNNVISWSVYSEEMVYDVTWNIKKHKLG